MGPDVGGEVAVSVVLSLSQGILRIAPDRAFRAGLDKLVAGHVLPTGTEANCPMPVALILDYRAADLPRKMWEGPR